jgi:hypothetical protein
MAQQRDPTAHATAFAQMMMNAASQDNRSGDNMLARMFTEEAARQRPATQTHLKLAMPNLQAKHNPKPTRRAAKGKKSEEQKQRVAGDIETIDGQMVMWTENPNGEGLIPVAVD